MSEQIRRLYTFGPFCLDPDKLALTREGRMIALPPKTLEALVLLVRHRDSPLDKDELIKLLWPDTFVLDINLTVHISKLRKLLGEAPGDHQYILTVPKRGYRFVAEVTELTELTEVAEATEVTESDVGPHPGAAIERARDDGEQRPDESRNRHRRRYRRLFAILAPIFLIGATVLAIRIIRWRAAPPARGIRSIAVIPFKPLGVDDRYSELGLEMADALTTKLSNIREIVVRPTTVVVRAHSQEQDPSAVGRKLSVDAVLEGRIQGNRGRIRVSVQLIRSSDGVPLWAERFDQSATDTFTLQDSISQRVADSLMLTLTGDEKTLLSKRYTQSDAAHLSYIRGRYFWDKRTPQDLKRAINNFNDAIDADPSYALAYAGLADSYLLLPFYTYTQSKDSIPKAREAAQRALEIDDSLAEAHASVGYAKFIYDWDWLGAETELSRSLALSPNYPTAHHWYADYLAAMGRDREA
ncbi:MAG TPA: winged helix-turn-helix domain-containing protein, partial [Blastocatellia bacterium]|nr:winged helix-turn-helix domain-containing protein [Blastocatellia bacterium]